MAYEAPGKHFRKGMSLIEIMRMFPDDATAEEWFVETRWPLARLRQLGPLTDDNLLIFRDRTPKGRHYTERPGAPPTRLQDSSFGAGCFGNAKSS